MFTGAIEIAFASFTACGCCDDGVGFACALTVGCGDGVLVVVAGVAVLTTLAGVAGLTCITGIVGCGVVAVLLTAFTCVVAWVLARVGDALTGVFAGVGN